MGAANVGVTYVAVTNVVVTNLVVTHVIVVPQVTSPSKQTHGDSSLSSCGSYPLLTGANGVVGSGGVEEPDGGGREARRILDHGEMADAIQHGDVGIGPALVQSVDHGDDRDGILIAPHHSEW